MNFDYDYDFFFHYHHYQNHYTNHLLDILSYLSHTRPIHDLECDGNIIKMIYCITLLSMRERERKRERERERGTTFFAGHREEEV